MTYICAKSYNHLHLNRGGTVHLCCPGWVTTPVGHILETSLIDIWQGDKVRAVRDSIACGEFRYCGSCPHAKTRSGPVQPMAVGESRPDSSKIGLLMMGYDFQCNLKCPSCRPDWVVQSTKEKIQIEDITNQLIASGTLKDVKVLGLIGGGDPFASSQCQLLLRSIPWSEYPDLKIIFFTNGLLLNVHCWSALGEIAKRVIEVRLSVDAATPETYALNRGGDWTTLMDNMRFIGTLRRTGQLSAVYYSFVVQANNYHEMIMFLRLAKSYHADHVEFSNLEQWGSYSTEDYKARAVHLPAHPQHRDFLSFQETTRGVMNVLF